jgi:adenine specific DNA methylase Mod
MDELESLIARRRELMQKRYLSGEESSMAAMNQIDEVEKDDILKWSDKGSSSHSAWLTFMYPRLYHTLT